MGEGLVPVAGVGRQARALRDRDKLAVARADDQRHDRHVGREGVLAQADPHPDRIERPGPVALVAVAPPLVGLGLRLGDRFQGHLGDRGHELQRAVVGGDDAGGRETQLAGLRDRQIRVDRPGLDLLAHELLELTGLKLGQHGCHARAPRVPNAPTRPAPAADRRVAEEHEGRLLAVVQAVAVAEEDVLRQRANRLGPSALHLGEPLQLMGRIGHDHRAVELGEVTADPAVGRAHAAVRQAVDLAVARPGLGVLGGLQPDPHPEQILEHGRLRGLEQHGKIGAGGQERIGAGDGHASRHVRPDEARDLAQGQAQLLLVAVHHAGIL